MSGWDRTGILPPTVFLPEMAKGISGMSLKCFWLLVLEHFNVHAGGLNSIRIPWLPWKPSVSLSLVPLETGSNTTCISLEGNLLPGHYIPATLCGPCKRCATIGKKSPTTNIKHFLQSITFYGPAEWQSSYTERQTKDNTRFIKLEDGSAFKDQADVIKPQYIYHYWSPLPPF